MTQQQKSPVGNILTLPAPYYHDPVLYEAERKAVFGAEWLLFAHESLIPEPGSYRAATVAGWPVFVIRGKDGILRGFHNVCRHRAGQVVREGDGKAGALRCLYHGWVYDDHGELKKTPGFGGDEAALCGTLSLFPIHVRVWNSLVFICLSDAAPPDFERSLGALPSVAGHLDFGAFQYFELASHELGCNWKTYIENYLEGYHIPAVHPGLNAEIDMATYRVTAHDRIALHEVGTKVPDAINDGLWVWLWPNAALNIYRGGMNLEIALPEGPETMRLQYCYLFKDLTDSAAAANARTIAMSRTVTQEDIEICEIVQRNLRAGIYQRGELSPRHEQGVAYFQALIADALKASKAPDTLPAVASL